MDSAVTPCLAFLKTAAQGLFLLCAVTGLWTVLLIYRKHPALRQEIAPDIGVRGVFQLIKVIGSRNTSEFLNFPRSGFLRLLWMTTGVAGGLLTLALVVWVAMDWFLR